MRRVDGHFWIHKLRKNWIVSTLVWLLALSISLSAVLSIIAVYIADVPPMISPIVFVSIFGLSLLIKPVWKVSNADISRFLNYQYPELEESADLLLKREEELSSVQRLQKIKIEQLISTIPSPKQPLRKIYASMVVLLVGLALSFAATQISPFAKGMNEEKFVGSPSKVKEIVPKAISAYSVTISPPPYTRNPIRKQKKLALRVESGSNVSWKLETSTPIKSFRLIFNDKEFISFKPSHDKTTFTYHKIVSKAGFYQLELDGKKSDLYPIDIIPDLPVAIKIHAPKTHTTIDIGQPQKINLNASLTDDYGISDAFISATMASGKGEGVSFTEKKISFNAAFRNKKEATFHKQLDLKDLGMKPGDELYFFINATDNHGQSSRSDIYFVSIVDTTELMSMAGMTNGVNLVPEYFRSQRQIIIDTEKLLKDQNNLSAANFKQRSNELGTDQKLLRLRYGKFLGEEDETAIGEEHNEHDGHDHGANASEEKKFGDVSSIMDKYAHKHDIAEDATFFEPELKAQLKAVLTEMWKSELQLRTYKPAAALPFEYKALRLLKDLQQKSRAYVAKTTVKKTVLKPEKRLSGELDKILQPVHKMSIEQKENRTTQLKTALALLEGRKTGKRFTFEDQAILNDVEKYMIVAAADHPETYLKALTSLKRLSASRKFNIKDIELAQQAIQTMIAIDLPKPTAQSNSPASRLYKSYFDNLKRAN